MIDIIKSLFFPEGYIPHGHCYLWHSSLVWLHVLSDLLMAIAYFSISFSLIYFIKQKKNVPFKGMFILFSLFIMSCGTTHLIEIWTLWYPVYWFSGLIKAITALISVLTAIELIPILPQAISLPSPQFLNQLNQKLSAEISEKEEAEISLKYQLALNKIITEILTDFINLKTHEFPAKIEEVLKRISLFTEVDNSQITRWDAEKKSFSTIYEWVAPGHQPLIEKSRNLAYLDYKWCVDNLLGGKVVTISSVIDSKHLTTIERQNLLAFDLKSIICIPLILETQVIGWISLASRTQTHVWQQSTIELLQNFSKIFSNAIIRQHTEKALEESKQFGLKLQHDVFHDSLTQLANRNLLTNRLNHALARQLRNQDWLFAILFIDLDRFKIINDSLGHLVGDLLLIALGKRLNQGLRVNDTLARLGGDEFVILIEDLRTPEDAIRLAERINQKLKQPFKIQEHELFISASIGIALSEAGKYQAASELLRDADIAMYRAKNSGKACHCIFDISMHENAMTRLKLENDLKRAIAKNELIIHYQPIFSLIDNQIIGVEALVRWQHSKMGTIAPNDFIGIAEETGYIIELDKWMLENACHQINEWKKQFPAYEKLTLNVNFSAKNFLGSDLIKTVNEILEKTDFEPKYLKLEITESILIKNTEEVETKLKELREKEIEICLDDFGTGYSSLSYLNTFPLNVLKLDRSFIQNILEEKSKRAIIQAIIIMSEQLGMKVVAEGIETEEQANLLKQINCFQGQGYWFSKPLNSQNMKKLLKEQALISS